MVCHGAQVAAVPADRPFVIGRGSGADLRLSDARVSRRHLMLRQTRTGWTVLDISANGTWLDGERVRQVDLDQEVRLNLGAANGPRITLTPGPPPSFPNYPLPRIPAAWPPEQRRGTRYSASTAPTERLAPSARAADRRTTPNGPAVPPSGHVSFDGDDPLADLGQTRLLHAVRLPAAAIGPRGLPYPAR